MRKFVLLGCVSMLSACGGGGAQSVGSSAPPVTPGGSTTGTHSFVNPTQSKTYSAIGGVQHYQYSTQDNTNVQSNELYAGNASTARNSGVSITYNPRDAIFELKISDGLANVSQDLRFQDPAHRTDFGGALEPQDGTPQLSRNSGVQYLQAGSSSGQLVFGPDSDTFPVGNADASRDVSTFFFQKPGTETQYVTFAGFVRNRTSIESVQIDNNPPFLRQNHVLERGAWAYGERTDNGAVPRTGTATFTGAMVASMVFNDQIDFNPSSPTYFQWIDGRATTTVDFGANSFAISLTGNVLAPQFDIFTDRSHTIQAGATFAAAGSGRIDLVNAGGFLGQMSSASFTQPGGAVLNVNIAGSSVDGAFFGPAAQEVGGGFRIVGGTPDERIDILGAFTGKK
ncbi:transferrin-binding protein-like solute binding protein [Sphingomonas sp. SCN 67-18]|uniref:transferrin-binding protein-like solute binding protein n=1 Tax=uncultured Sphingomonas sp. TaxID=158754 RepID=UPI0025D9697D|nr:transferrin-binding protein-like solute binding protein [Sphingomonas sp. SCN 67-18]